MVTTMTLKMLYRKEVMIDTTEGQFFVGRVVDCFSEGNDKRKESII